MPTPPDYHWSPANQRRFLQSLAETGSVHLAARAVGMSPQSARRFRKTQDKTEHGGTFATGWDAAILIAQAWIADALFDAALEGTVQVRTCNANTRRQGWRQESALFSRGKGTALLRRIDAAAERIAAAPDRLARANHAAQDFDAFLQRIDSVPPKQRFMWNLSRNSASSAQAEMPASCALPANKAGQAAHPSPSV